MTEQDDFEKRLIRLRDQTGDIVARADFVERVMARVEQAPASVLTMDWAAQVLGLARIGVVLAGMTAAAFMAVAWDRASSADQEEALAYGVVEAFE